MTTPQGDENSREYWELQATKADYTGRIIISLMLIYAWAIFFLSFFHVVASLWLAFTMLVPLYAGLRLNHIYAEKQLKKYARRIK